MPQFGLSRPNGAASRGGGADLPLEELGLRGWNPRTKTKEAEDKKAAAEVQRATPVRWQATAGRQAKAARWQGVERAAAAASAAEPARWQSMRSWQAAAARRQALATRAEARPEEERAEATTDDDG